MKFRKPQSASDFGELTNISWPQISLQLENQVLEFLKGQQFWKESRPIFLGSLSRHELCPNSDLDLLFLGEDEAVASVVRACQEKGLKLRSRKPLDLSDWSVGVESFDLLSLLNARPAFESEAELLHVQVKKLKSQKKLKTKIKKDLIRDRKQRRKIFDSMTQLLEPQLKSGPGGLRDIQQALDLLQLFEDPFEEGTKQKAEDVLKKVKKLLLQVRFELHQMGLDDQFVAAAQLDLSTRYGFEKTQDLTREVSRELSRAYFYTDWVFARLQADQKAKDSLRRFQFRKPEDALKLLKKNSSTLAQAKIRTEMDRVFLKKISQKRRGLLLWQSISFENDSEFTEAIFRSRIFDFLCPQIRRLEGWIQHDQYHRWTAAAHLMKVIQQVQNTFRDPKKIKSLAKTARGLRRQDWQILAWTALYHDLTKARDGDHSKTGREEVLADFRSFGIPKKISEEVQFLVEHHLRLSTLAFRQNVEDAKTWQDFWDFGFTEARIRRLAVFTAIDIIGTNPEAFNQWKSDLLLKAMNQLLQPERQKFLQSQKILKKGKFKDEFFEVFDPELFSYFSGATLQNDLLMIRKEQVSGVVVLKDVKKRKWIRFYHPKNTEGLFQNYVYALFEAGFRIDQALIQTLPNFGVYDLFQVRTENFTRAWTRLNRVFTSQEKVFQDPGSFSTAADFKFEKIEVLETLQDRAVISFRGLDQRGILLRLTQALREQKLSVIKAQIHTWGRQIEDLITVENCEDLDQRVSKLKEKLLRV